MKLKPLRLRYVLLVLPLLLLLLLLFAGMPAQAQTITNPSFETPVTSTFLQVTTANLTGWTVAGAVDVNTNNNAAGIGVAPDGTQVLELQFQGASITQTVAGLTVGHLYRLTLASGYRNTFEGGAILNVAAAGTTAGTITPAQSITNSAGAYTDQSVTFTATATSEALSLTVTNATSSNGVIFIDNLRLVDTGVPALSPGSLTAATVTTTSITPQESGITYGTAPYSTVFSFSSATNGTYTQIGTAVAGASPIANAAATGLSQGTTYYFRAVTTDSAGTPATIITPSATTGTPLSTAAVVPTTFAANAAGLYYSPYTWATGKTNCSGAYLVIPLTTTSAGPVTLNLNTASLSNPEPTLVWSLDGGPYLPPAGSGQSLTTGLQLSAGNLTGTAPNQMVTLFTNLPAGNHIIRIWVRSENSTSGGIWGSGIVTLTGITAPNGATLNTYTALLLNILFFGDSITEGEGSDGYAAANLPLNNSALDNWTWYVAHALGAEYGNVGSGGQSYSGAGANGFPAFNTSWNQVNSTVSRLTAGKFSPAPDYVFVNQGTNGGTSAADVSAMMTNLRAASGAATKIIFLIPFGQQSRGSILSGLSNYSGTTQSIPGPNGSTIYNAGTDTNTWVIDLGAAASIGLFGAPATEQSFDGTHPSAQTSAKLAALLTQAIQAKTGGTTAIKRRIQ